MHLHIVRESQMWDDVRTPKVVPLWIGGRGWEGWRRADALWRVGAEILYMYNSVIDGNIHYYT